MFSKLYSLYSILNIVPPPDFAQGDKENRFGSNTSFLSRPPHLLRLWSWISASQEKNEEREGGGDCRCQFCFSRFAKEEGRSESKAFGKQARALPCVATWSRDDGIVVRALKSFNIYAVTVVSASRT